MNLRFVSWALYIFGLALIPGSWVKLVTPGIGGLGWLIGMTGWGLGFLVKKRSVDPKVVVELEHLATLHALGQISEEDYQMERARLMGPRGT